MTKKKIELTKQERHINEILRKRHIVKIEQRPVEFPQGEPEYWYVEYDVEAKMLEGRLGKFIVRVPQETVLSWFMNTEYNNLRLNRKTET